MFSSAMLAAEDPLQATSARNIVSIIVSVIFEFFIFINNKCIFEISDTQLL